MNSYRLRNLYLVFLLILAGVVLRLAYWQLVKGSELRVEARDQHRQESVLTPNRGEIITADGYPLVHNRPVYSLTAYTPHLELSSRELADRILPLLEFDLNTPEYATDPGRRQARLQELQAIKRGEMIDRLDNQSYAVLARGLSVDQHSKLQALNILGLGFEDGFTRSYPEASMAAQLLGFVGRDELGSPQGYFGLEGYYDRELRGQAGLEVEERDAVGNPLIIGDYRTLSGRKGRQLRLHLERSVQFLLETSLKEGLKRYGALSGEVLVMDPATGGILGLASFPNYDPTLFYKFDSKLYKNPSVAEAFEPGSIFKIITMAAALEEQAVKLDDRCDVCASPLPIGKYQIKTWDGQYHPGSTPEQILENSDNVGMVWIEQRLGGDKFLSYIKSFGFGEKTGIDLQEEATPLLRAQWGEIDYATASFGQGIAVTSIQMLRAAAAIANEGKLVEPHLVAEVIGQESQALSPKTVRQVISPETAKTVTELMVTAAEHGDAKWTRLPDYTVAGKTGTAQIPVEGHYDQEKTIASFVGFVPANKPRFVMLVKLREPSSSPWGSETAAPLWFTIAKKLLTHYQIPPNSH